MRWNLTEHSRMHDDIFSEESDTCQNGTALHANTKELDGAQTNGHRANLRARWNLTEHSQVPMIAETTDRAHALTSASKKFSKDFFDPKVLKTSKY